jgi:hypothetical protein
MAVELPALKRSRSGEPWREIYGNGGALPPAHGMAIEARASA